MLELRLLLVGLFYCFRALLLRLGRLGRRAVRGVALREVSGCVGRGGGVFVCMRTASVYRPRRLCVSVRAARRCGGRAFGVCVRGQLRRPQSCSAAVSVWPRRGVSGRPRRWRRCGAALRRCAAAGGGPRRRVRPVSDARQNVVFWPFQTPAAHQNRRHDVSYCCSAAPRLRRCCGAVRGALKPFWSQTKLAN